MHRALALAKPSSQEVAAGAVKVAPLKESPVVPIHPIGTNRIHRLSNPRSRREIHLLKPTVVSNSITIVPTTTLTTIALTTTTLITIALEIRGEL